MRGMSRLVAAAAAASAIGRTLVPVIETPAEPDGPKIKRSGRLREPSGHSFRSLRRAFNSGWRPPTIKIKPERKLLYLSRATRERATQIASANRQGEQ